jgi:hypothetical protein
VDGVGRHAILLSKEWIEVVFVDEGSIPQIKHKRIVVVGNPEDEIWCVAFVRACLADVE